MKNAQSDAKKLELSSLIDRACSVLDRAPEKRGMTPFQIRVFLIQREPTDWGAYHQACLEIRSRLDVLESARIDLETFDARPALGARDRARVFAEKKHVLDNIEAASAELSTLVDLASELRMRLPKDEKWEDDRVQEEYWRAKLTREAVLSVEAGVLNVPCPIVEAVSCLSEKSKISFLSALDSHLDGLAEKPSVLLEGETAETKSSR